MKKIKTLLIALLTMVCVFCFSMFFGCVEDEPPTTPQGPGQEQGGGDETPVTLVVTGVQNGAVVEYGTQIVPVFNVGSATLKKDGGMPISFASGTAITELGSYVLTVTYGTDVKTYNFSIVLPDYTGMIADEFIGSTASADYFSSDAAFRIDNGDLVITDKPGNANPWAVVVRPYQDVNLTEFPLIGLNLKEVTKCAFEFKLTTVDPGGSTPPTEDQTITFRCEYNGEYYFNVKEQAEAKGWNLQSQDLYVTLGISGGSSEIGSMKVLLDYFKSAKTVPMRTAGRYSDTDAEGFATWVNQTARLDWVPGYNKACGLIIGQEDFGQVNKRVLLNTRDYPYLYIDVDTIVEGWALKAYKFDNYILQPTEYTIISDSTLGMSVGKFEIDLRDVLGESECMDTVLCLYMVGKGESDTEFFSIKKIETNATAQIGLEISGITNGAEIDVNDEPSLLFNLGTATISKDGGNATNYVSGQKITEKGSYTIVVTYGTTVETINFTVTGELEPLDLEGYTSTDGFTIEHGGSVSYDNGVFTFTRDGSDAGGTKLNKNYNISFTHGKYMVVKVKGLNGYTPDAGFGFELLQTNGDWIQLSKKLTDAAKVITSYDGTMTIYWEITTPNNLSQGGLAESWIGTTQNGITLSFMIEYGETVKAVQMKGVSFVDVLPETPDYTGMVADEFKTNTVVGNYQLYDNLNMVVENEDMILSQVASSNYYGSAKICFTGLDLTTYKYLAINFKEINNCSINVKIAGVEWPGAESENTTTVTSAGITYIDLSALQTSIGLTDTVWLSFQPVSLTVEGSVTTAPYSVVIGDYISLESMPS